MDHEPAARLQRSSLTVTRQVQRTAWRRQSVKGVLVSGIVSACLSNPTCKGGSIQDGDKSTIFLGGGYKQFLGGGYKQFFGQPSPFYIQVVLVTSVGTDAPFFPLNLLWGVLFWKKRAEEALQRSGLDYTIIRPGTAMFPLLYPASSMQRIYLRVPFWKKVAK